VLFSLLLLLALCFCSSAPAVGQDLASAQAEVKRVFEEELHRLTPDGARAALPTVQYLAANAAEFEAQALARRALGEIARLVRDFAAAEADFRAVISLYPSSSQVAWAHSGLGEMCRDLSRSQARPELLNTALAEFRMAMASNPGQLVGGRTLEKIALTCLDVRDYQGAVQTYSQLIAAYPATPEAVYAHGGLAQAYWALRRWDDGVNEARIRAGSTGYPRCAEFQLMAGVILGRKGDYAAAAAELDKVVAAVQAPTDEVRLMALYQKGFCLKALGDLSGAAAAWRRVIAESPFDYLSVRAREQLGLLGAL
jgi:tetratricopeptide (TPR) repeat protein